jgi:hypothetical protein
MFDPVPAEVKTLRREVVVLSGEEAGEVRLESLPGFSAVDGCSVVCGVGDSDRGV